MTPFAIAPETRHFVRRVVIVVGVVAGVTLLLAGAVFLFDVLLLVFAGILFGLLLDGLARLLAERTPLGRGAALGVVGAVLLGTLVGIALTVGPSVAAQFGALDEGLRDGYAQLLSFVRATPLLQPLAESLPSPDDVGGEASRVVQYLPTFFSVVLGAVTTTFVILVAGTYFAASPGLYVRGLVLLVPRPHRAYARHVVEAVVRAVKKWLVGQFVLMVFVGATTTLGLVVLGIPLPYTLGLLAFFLNFIPILGPIIAAVPATLIAFLVSPAAAVQVLLLYTVVQQVESYVVAPYVQKRIVSLPPVMLILSQVLFGSVAGLLGITLATPLIVALIVVVQMIYVEGMLRTDVDVLGEEPEPPPEPPAPVHPPGSIAEAVYAGVTGAPRAE